MFVGAMRWHMKKTPQRERDIIGKDALIRQIAARTDMNLQSTNRIIDAFTEVVQENVALGHIVRLMGFGTWRLRNIAPRQVKSIRSGTQITIPAHKRVSFSVGMTFSQVTRESEPADAEVRDVRLEAGERPGRCACGRGPVVGVERLGPVVGVERLAGERSKLVSAETRLIYYCSYGNHTVALLKRDIKYNLRGEALCPEHNEPMKRRKNEKDTE